MDYWAVKMKEYIYLEINSYRGKYSWGLYTPQWDAINALMWYINPHPAPQLGIMDTGTLTEKETIGWANAILTFTGVTVHNKLPPNLLQMYKWHHVDDWAPIAQRILQVNATKMVISTRILRKS
jgi:hypothetical protein